MSTDPNFPERFAEKELEGKKLKSGDEDAAQQRGREAGATPRRGMRYQVGRFIENLQCVAHMFEYSIVIAKSTIIVQQCRMRSNSSRVEEKKSRIFYEKNVYSLVQVMAIHVEVLMSRIVRQLDSNT